MGVIAGFSWKRNPLTKENEQPLSGELIGLEPDGSLQLKVNNNSLTVQIGEIHLRPAW